MPEEFPADNEFHLPSKEETQSINQEVASKLGNIVINDYSRLPRKTKKAAKKHREGRPLGQQELARLEAIRRRSSSAEI